MTFHSPIRRPCVRVLTCLTRRRWRFSHSSSCLFIKHQTSPPNQPPFNSSSSSWIISFLSFDWLIYLGMRGNYIFYFYKKKRLCLLCLMCKIQNTEYWIQYTEYRIENRLWKNKFIIHKWVMYYMLKPDIFSLSLTDYARPCGRAGVGVGVGVGVGMGWGGVGWGGVGRACTYVYLNYVYLKYTTDPSGVANKYYIAWVVDHYHHFNTM